VPTFVLIGGQDRIYPVPASEQAALLTGFDDVTAVTLPPTGHAVTLHRHGRPVPGPGLQAARQQELHQHGVAG